MILSSRIKIQLVVFLLLAVAGIIYTGLAFVGISIPLISHGPYDIKADFTDSGGIFTHAEVAYRGVNVGRVTGMQLIPTGVRVTMSIKHGVNIPQGSNAKIANLSAVGEQYVNIIPSRAGAPYMPHGGIIPASRTTSPIEDSVLLANLNAFVTSVDTKNLGIDIDELGRAFTGTATNLQQLIDQGTKLNEAAQNALPQTIRLLDDGKKALATQNAVAGELRTFTSNLAQLSQQIVNSDPDIRGVLDNGVPAANQIAGLIQDNQHELPILLDNLTTLGRIQAARLPGLKAILVLFPEDVANGFYGAAGGYAHFGLVSQLNPPTCDATNGFVNAAAKTNPDNVKHRKAALNTYCTASPQGSNKPDVRGARNVPRPSGDTTNLPPYRPTGGKVHTISPVGDNPSQIRASSGGAAAVGSARAGGVSLGLPWESAPSTGGVVVAPYDPATGVVRLPNGRTFRIGGDSTLSRLSASDTSLAGLLLGPAVG